MTTFHGSTDRTATIDRRTLTVVTSDGTTTTHPNLESATLRALAYVSNQWR